MRLFVLIVAVTLITLLQQHHVMGATLVIGEYRGRSRGSKNCSYPTRVLRLDAADPGSGQWGPCQKWVNPNGGGDKYYFKFRCNSQTSLAIQRYADSSCSGASVSSVASQTIGTCDTPPGKHLGLAASSSSIWSHNLRCHNLNENTPLSSDAAATDSRYRVSLYSDALLEWDETANFLATVQDQSSALPRICYRFVSRSGSRVNFFHFTVDRGTGVPSQWTCSDNDCTSCSRTHTMRLLDADAAGAGKKKNVSAYFDASMMVSHTSVTMGDYVKGGLPFMVRFTGRLLNVTSSGFYQELTGFESHSCFSSVPTVKSNVFSSDRHYFPNSGGGSGGFFCTQSALPSQVGRVQRNLRCTTSTPAGTSTLTETMYGVKPGGSSEASVAAASHSVTDCRTSTPWSTLSYSGCFLAPGTDKRRNEVDCTGGLPGSGGMEVFALVMQIKSPVSEESVAGGGSASASLDWGRALTGDGGGGNVIITFGVVMLIVITLMVLWSTYFCEPDIDAVAESWFLPSAKGAPGMRMAAIGVIALLSVVAPLLGCLQNPPDEYTVGDSTNFPIAFFNGTGFVARHSWVIRGLQTSAAGTASATSCPDYDLVKIAGQLGTSAIAMPLPVLVFLCFFGLLLCEDNCYASQHKSSVDTCATMLTFGSGFVLLVVTPIALAASRMSHLAAISCGIPELLQAAWLFGVQTALLLVLNFLWNHAHCVTDTHVLLSHRFMWQSIFYSVGIASATCTPDPAVHAGYCIVAVLFLIVNYVVECTQLDSSARTLSTGGAIVWSAVIEGSVGLVLVVLAGVFGVGADEPNVTNVELMLLLTTVFGAAPAVMLFIGGMCAGVVLCCQSCCDKLCSACESYQQQRAVERQQEYDAAVKQFKADQESQRFNAEQEETGARKSGLEPAEAQERDAIVAARQAAMDDMMRSVPCAPDGVLKRGIGAADSGQWTLYFKTQLPPSSPAGFSSPTTSNGTTTSGQQHAMTISIPLPQHLFPNPASVVSAVHTRCRRYLVVSSALEQGKNCAWLFDTTVGGGPTPGGAAGHPQASAGVSVSAAVSTLFAHELQPAMLFSALAVSYWALHGKNSQQLQKRVAEMVAEAQRSSDDLQAAEDRLREAVRAELDLLEEQRMQAAGHGAKMFAGGHGSGLSSAAPTPKHPGGAGGDNLGNFANSALDAVSAITQSGQFNPEAVAQHSGPRGNQLVSSRNRDTGQIMTITERWESLGSIGKQHICELYKRRRAERAKCRDTMLRAVEFCRAMKLSLPSSAPPSPNAPSSSSSNNNKNSNSDASFADLVDAAKTLMEVEQLLDETDQQWAAFSDTMVIDSDDATPTPITPSPGGPSVQDMLVVVGQFQPAQQQQQQQQPLPPTGKPLPPRLRQALEKEAERARALQPSATPAHAAGDSSSSPPSGGSNNPLSSSPPRNQQQEFNVSQFALNLTDRQHFTWQLVGLLGHSLNPLLLFLSETVDQVRSTSSSLSTLEHLVSAWVASEESRQERELHSAAAGGRGKNENVPFIDADWEKSILDMEGEYRLADDQQLELTIELVSLKARYDAYIQRQPHVAKQLAGTIASTRRQINALKHKIEVQLAPEFTRVFTERPELVLLVDAPDVDGMETDDLDRYEHKNLGHGSSRNQIYLAKSSPDSGGWDIVIKELQLETEKHRRHFARQIKLLRRAKHPRLMPVEKVFYSQDLSTGYLVMRFMKNGTLEDFFHSQAREQDPSRRVLTLEWFRSAVRDILNALAFMHSLGIIHLDIKVQNILINDQHECLIADFDVSVDPAENAAKTMTATSAAGTIGMMAPELQGGNVAAVSPKCDMYSLGKTLEVSVAALQQNFVGLLPSDSTLHDLIKQLVAENPAKRPAAHEALLHPFLQRGSVEAERQYKQTIVQEKERYAQRTQELARLQSEAAAVQRRQAEDIAAREKALADARQRNEENQRKTSQLGQEAADFKAKTAQLSDAVAKAEKEVKDAKAAADKAMRDAKAKIAEAEAARSAASYQNLPAYWDLTDPLSNAPGRKIDCTSQMKTIMQQLIDATSEPTHGKGQDQKVKMNYSKMEVQRVYRIENARTYRHYAEKRFEMANTRKRPSMDPSEILTMQTTSSGRVDPSKYSDAASWVNKLGLNKQVCEVLTWHGTSPSTAELIIQAGLNEKFSHLKCLFGAACYLAVNATKSDQYASHGSNNEFPLFLCRACAGTPLKTNGGNQFHDKRMAPLFDDSDPGGGRYDSIFGSGLHAFYKELVVYENEQTYPEWLIIYKRK